MTSERQHTDVSLLKDQLNASRDESLNKIIPKYQSIQDEMVFEAVWNRDGLSLDERFICVLACLAVKRCTKKLKAKLNLALDSGLSARSISEVFLQAGLYVGLPVTEEAAKVAAEVFDERDVVVDQENLPRENWETLVREATEFKNTLHGERSEKGHANPNDCYTNELYKIATIYGYGMVWRRPGLDTRKRLIVAIACFASLESLDSFFIKFCRSGMDHGMSIEEIQEIIIQLSPYIGFPLGLAALTKLRRATDDT